LLQIVRDSLLGRNTYTMTKKVKQNKKFVKY
jgi:hypothetical protein